MATAMALVRRLLDAAYADIERRVEEDSAKNQQRAGGTAYAPPPLRYMIAA